MSPSRPRRRSRPLSSVSLGTGRPPPPSPPHCATIDVKLVFSACDFEKHAANLIKKKHPADFTHFRNGKDIPSVLEACEAAPSAMLAACIHNAISPRPKSYNSTCQKCKGFAAA